MAEAPEAAGARSPLLSVTRPRFVLPVNDDNIDPLRRLPGSPPARSVPGGVNPEPCDYAMWFGY